MRKRNLVAFSCFLFVLQLQSPTDSARGQQGTVYRGVTRRGLLRLPPGRGNELGPRVSPSRSMTPRPSKPGWSSWRPGSRKPARPS